MMLEWLKAKACGGIAILLAAMLAWQTARIDGWPLTGGGLNAQVADLQARIVARDLAMAQAQAAALSAHQAQIAAANRIAGASAARDRDVETQIQTIIREVPAHVSAQSDLSCPVPWGVVRLLDAAASGADLGNVAARIAPGQPDDAASDVKLSEIVALQSGNLGAARRNAEQLSALEQAVTP